MSRRVGFRAWLWQQHRRDDAVGDLARDCRDDPGLRGKRLTPASLVAYLREEHPGACAGALKAAERAGEEHQREHG